MAKGDWEGATAVMDMENTAHNLPVFKGITLEAILSQQNLAEALKRVEANKGAPGVDGMRTDELRDYIYQHPGELRSAILSGEYRPAPVKRVTIPKTRKGEVQKSWNTDGHRPSCPTGSRTGSLKPLRQHVLDAQLRLPPRPTAQMAVLRVSGAAQAGYVWAVDMDLEKFFDTVNHSRLLRKLSTQIKDARVISLICRMLKSGISIDGKVEASEIGLMQGGPLSPLLANIYLDELDKELELRGHEFARYADDLVIVCKSKRAALRTLDSVTRFVENRMKLKVNREKTTVSYITGGIKFLGHGYAKLKDGFVPTVHAKSKKRLKDDLRQILARNRKMSIEEVKEALRMKLRGWCNYFKYAKCRAWLSGDVDQWCRRRIRQLLWKTWKSVRTRMRALQLLGCSKEQAYQWACTRKSYWRIANSHVLSTTLNNDFLKAHNWCWPGLIWAEVDGS